MKKLLPNIEWISVLDRVPEGLVLAVNLEEKMKIGYCFKEGAYYSCEGEGGCEKLVGVTHWIELKDLRTLLRLQKLMK